MNSTPDRDELLADEAVEYEDQAYVEGVRDLARMITADKAANWKAVAGVLCDCADIMERQGRAALRTPTPVADEALVERATGYSDAFYQIGKMLGIPAQDRTPAEVWHKQMRPMLEAALQQVQPLDGALRAIEGRVKTASNLFHNSQQWHEEDGLDGEATLWDWVFAPVRSAIRQLDVRPETEG